MKNILQSAIRLIRKGKKATAIFNTLMVAFMLLSLLGLPQGALALDTITTGTTITIQPITWNVIGLDSNDVNTGPNHFPVGAEICNLTGASLDVTSIDFIWDDGLDAYTGDPYINLRAATTGTLGPVTLAASGTPGDCYEAYFEVEVTRDANAYDQTRAYHITATDSSETVSTITPRELYVEHLVSQNRNSTNSIEYKNVNDSTFTTILPGGTLNFELGETYDIVLYASTATNGYEQIETFINLPNTIFHINSVQTAYTADSSAYVSNPDNYLYGDACLWDNDPASGTYRSCLDTGKAGGDVIVTYEVTILSVPSSQPQSLNSLIYDFSGSSYHYNNDYDAGYAVDIYIPPTVQKGFTIATIDPGSSTTMQLTMTNPVTNPGPLTGVQVYDYFPTGMSLFDTSFSFTPTGVTSGCGSITNLTGGTSAAGDLGVIFNVDSLDPGASCQADLHVTVTGAAQYNTTVTNCTENVTASGPVPLIGLNACADLSVTPVTLSYFDSVRHGVNVEFNWSTETENGNIGFNLYVADGDTLTQINSQLIPSNAVDSLDRQDYSYKAKVSGNTFYIEDVDIFGQTLRHGPFTLGQSYGVQLSTSSVDWNSIQAEHNAKADKRQNELKQQMNTNNGKGNSSLPGSQPLAQSGASQITFAANASMLSASLSQPSALNAKKTPTPTPTPVPTATPVPTQPPVVGATAVAYDPADLQLQNTYNIEVSQTGIYRLTYEMLQSAGLDLSGYQASEITVLNQGLMIPAYVYTPDSSGNFGPGGYIEFYGQALDTLYTGTNIYTVQVSSAAVPQIPLLDAAPAAGAVSPAMFTDELKVNRQLHYAQYAPGSDPWYDTHMMVYTSPNSWNFTFQVSGLADPSAVANLNLVVWGVTSLSESWPHHLTASINGVQVSNATFSGLVEKTINVDIPGGTLVEGTNTLTLTLLGDQGAPYDMVDLDKYSVSYPRVFQAQNGQLTFSAVGDAFTVTNLPTGNVVVYRQDSDGMVQLTNVNVQASGNTYTASFAGESQNARYVVTTVEGENSPLLSATSQPSSNLDQPAQYLIISHPDFIDGLAPLVQAKQAQGLTVNVVNVEDLYTRYTYGVFDPQAISDYISYAYQNLGAKYVLLVGGDTYDYRNYLGLNSISFIPSLYAATKSVSRYVPVDPLYADVNGDGVPDLAIGRFPVRNSAQLDLMVNKTLEYANKDYGKTAFFVADAIDGSLSFKDISNGLAASLPSDWTVNTDNLDDVDLSTARTQLTDAMNNGTALVTFTGHSGPISWAVNDVFDTNNAAALTNTGRPFVAVQWGCWNTYAVSPVGTYLVQALLFSGNQGSAAVLGATTLSSPLSEQLLGSLLTPQMVQPGMTIGQALQDAKSQLAQTNPGLVDVQLGWTLMGDPALVVSP